MTLYEPENLHEAQTAILVWIWENDGLIMDGEAMQIAIDRDGPWRITIAGMDYLAELRALKME